MKKIIAFLVLVFTIMTIGVLLFAKDVDVSLSEERVQKIINQKITGDPISSRGVELHIKKAIIDFHQNNTASVEIEYKAKGYGYSGYMRGVFWTGLRYDAPKIYLANISPVKLETTFDPETSKRFTDLKNVATDLLKRQRDEMLSEEAKKSLDNIVGRNTETLKSLVASATYKFFETLPLYDLNDAGVKGSISALALKKVSFTENSVVITLSPRQAVLKILTFIFFSLMSLLMLFIYFGAWIPSKKETA